MSPPYQGPVAGAAPAYAAPLQPQLSPSQPYQIVYVREAERSLQHYPARSSTALGVIQIICGLACIILGGCAIGFHATLFFVGHGIWGGICVSLSLAYCCDGSIIE